MKVKIVRYKNWDDYEYDHIGDILEVTDPDHSSSCYISEIIYDDENSYENTTDDGRLLIWKDCCEVIEDSIQVYEGRSFKDIMSVKKEDIIEKFFEHKKNHFGNKPCKLSDFWHLNSYGNIEHYETDEYTGLKRFIPVSWKIFYDFLQNVYYYQKEKENEDSTFKLLDWSFTKDIEVKK